MMTAADLEARRALALAHPCARASDTLDPRFAFRAAWRSNRWGVILTINR